MKLLALDTSAKAASAALLEEDKILAEYSVNLGLTHSQTILPMCEALLRQSGLSLSGLDYFAVSNGPGSFTGLRIGIAAVKGMAYAVKKPCVAVSTLDALAWNLSDCSATVCCVMDARCHQVYNALYDVRPGRVEKRTPDRAISLDELYEELKTEKNPVILVGDGADLCYNEYKERLSGIVLCGAANRYQRAASVGLAAWRQIQAGNTVDAGSLMPAYLRLPQAERELKKKRRLET